MSKFCRACGGEVKPDDNFCGQCGTVVSSPEKTKGAVDIVFLMDATGSMQPVIDNLKNNIKGFIDELDVGAHNQNPVKYWRAKVVGYRDFIYDHVPIEDNPFVDNTEEIYAQFDRLKADGGGDEPESLLEGIYHVANQGQTGRGEPLSPNKWRYRGEGIRMVIVFTDASYHEVMERPEGGTFDDVVNICHGNRIILQVFAPEMECYERLAEIDKSDFYLIAYDESDEDGAAKALRDFTVDKNNFRGTLNAMAKTVSQSEACPDLLDGVVGGDLMIIEQPDLPSMPSMEKIELPKAGLDSAKVAGCKIWEGMSAEEIMMANQEIEYVHEGDDSEEGGSQGDRITSTGSVATGGGTVEVDNTKIIGSGNVINQGERLKKCGISGREVKQTEGRVCLKCGIWVCNEVFLDAKEWCQNCEDKAEEQYEEPGRAFAESRPNSSISTQTVQVNFSAMAQGQLEAGAQFILDIWAHTESQTEQVKARANEMGRGDLKGTKQGVEIVQGSVLKVHLSLPGFEVAEPVDSLTWNGALVNASFPVTVPKDCTEGSHLGTATIHSHGLMICKLHFQIEIGVGARAASDDLTMKTERPRTAFASYSSQNRNEVLGCLQGMQKVAPELDVDIDVVSLRSGQDYREALERLIPAKDVFFLFWSKPASESKEVDWEWRLALRNKGLGFIDPVPLEDPRQVPPPEELSSLHFNDKWLAFKGR